MPDVTDHLLCVNATRKKLEVAKQKEVVEPAIR